MVGKASASRIQLELRRVVRPQSESHTLITQILSAPKPIYYQRWNHVVIVHKAQTLTWVINGEIYTQNSEYDVSRGVDQRVHFGTYTKKVKMRPLNMRIDDVRISRGAIPLAWIQRAYRARVNSSKTLDQDSLPPVTLFY